ncbi:MAG: hypothetical protein EKK59_04465 [Neisseriaceae bacterium]|nr:MAG: hypothetical protein EKK59_04465 [Neisseriaceae bacterium]
MLAELIYTGAGLALFVSAACRAIKHMDVSTRADVRWAIALQGMAGFGAAVIPWVRPELIEACLAAMVASSAAVQIVTSRLWPAGRAPSAFERRRIGRSRVWSEP